MPIEASPGPGDGDPRTASTNLTEKATVDRRTALGATAAAVAGGAVTAGLFVDAARSGAAPRDNTGDADRSLNISPHLFRLTASKPTQFEGGTLRGANEETFPVLRGRNGAVYYVRLDVGGIREPHWHPTAWELNFVISGRAKWVVIGTHPDGVYRNDAFEAGPGDLVFVPQGFFHYFENSDDIEPLQVLVIFNTSAPETVDDIGIRAALNSVPRGVLSAVLGVPAATFENVPDDLRPVVICKRNQ